MIHLKRFHLDIHIHFLTSIYILIAYLGHYLTSYLIALTIVCIHELCHLLMAYYFHFTINKIEILPFGAYLSLDDFYFHPISHELCVVLAGPCSHLFMYYIISNLFQGALQEELYLMNSFVFFFNLLPIYPMDGHRVISLILQSFIDLKSALYFSLKISVFSFVVLSFFYFRYNTFVIICYLFYQQFLLMKFIPTYLREFYSKIPSLYQREKVKIHNNLYYHRGYHNYYFFNSILYDEKDVIFDLLKSIKK
ncbi:MAG: hypothetical protein HFF36_09870 [Coprobacillus sp.]|nr:hypothetical protein [Coprobacillus sp.]